MLTKLEADILQMTWDGEDSQGIARKMGIHATNIDAAKVRLYYKWGVKNAVQLVKEGLARRLLKVPKRKEDV